MSNKFYIAIFARMPLALGYNSWKPLILASLDSSVSSFKISYPQELRHLNIQMVNNLNSILSPLYHFDEIVLDSLTFLLQISENKAQYAVLGNHHLFFIDWGKSNPSKAEISLCIHHPWPKKLNKLKERSEGLWDSG